MADGLICGVARRREMAEEGLEVWDRSERIGDLYVELGQREEEADV